MEKYRTPARTREPTIRRCFCLFALTVWVLAIGVMTHRAYQDRKYLKNLSSELLESYDTSSEKAKRVIRWLHDDFARGGSRQMRALIQKDLLDRTFSLLGYRPAIIARSRAGDCSDRVRVAIALLHYQGIRATRLALHDAKGISRHAVIEVQTERGLAVMDPLTGLWFCRPNGEFYSASDLKNAPELLPSLLQEWQQKKDSPQAISAAHYTLDHWNYGDPRTYNWSKTPVHRATYTIGSAILGKRINRLWRPMFLERPGWLAMLTVVLVPCLVVMTRVIARRVGKLFCNRRSNTRRDAKVQLNVSQ